MGIMDFVRKQFLDIIEWEDSDSKDIVYKFPMADNEIQNDAKLIVRPGQCAIFVNEGKIADAFTEPGTYTLNTGNLPILTDLKNWAYGFKSPFKSDVYFVSTKIFLDQKWGTPAPVLLSDPKFEQVEIRAFGTYCFRISEPEQLLTTVTGTNQSFTVDQINQQLKSFIVSRFAPIVAQQKVTVAQLVENYHIMDEAVIEAVRSNFKNLGLEITTFVIESITLQEEYQQMLRTRSSINILGGMQNYAQVETLEAMKESAKNPGMNSANQTGMGFGIGLGMANMFTQNMQNALNNSSLPNQQQQYQQQQQQYQQQQQPNSANTGTVQNEASVECSNCNAKLAADSLFCNKCGTKVEPKTQKSNFCSKCGNKVNDDSMFCNKCGNKLS